MARTRVLQGWAEEQGLESEPVVARKDVRRLLGSGKTGRPGAAQNSPRPLHWRHASVAVQEAGFVSAGHVAEKVHVSASQSAASLSEKLAGSAGAPCWQAKLEARMVAVPAVAPFRIRTEAE